MKAKGLFYRLYNQRHLQAMALPGLIWMIVFCYLPMYGIIIAFKDYNILKPMLSAPWADKGGFAHFIEFFQDERFGPVLLNTAGISFFKILIGFPLPILFAILLNELRQASFKRVVQTVTYLPHFISWVILGGLIMNWLADVGLFNEILMKLGIIREPVFFLAEPRYFWGIAVLSDVWKETGWNAIIYLAAIAGINPELYEAATVDGARRFGRIWHVTLPGIRGTIAILFVLSIAYLFNTNFDQIFVLKNQLNAPASDVMDIFVYRMGISLGRFSYSTAIGLLKSIVALSLLLSANAAAKKLTGASLYH